MENKLKNKPKILGLDISSKTIGWAIFDIADAKLLEASHFSPKIKPQPEDKIEELIKKADIFKKHLEQYKDVGITKVVIEEPLLQSNNIYTVGTLIRFNTMVMRDCYNIFGVVPTFISTYNSRKYAFPDLVGLNDKGKMVLFGGYPKDIDKKHIIWEHVNNVCPEMEWFYDKNNKLKKENYDTADAITCVIGHINMQKLIQ
jgi:Holliday junction resolvasome RuvABC endonuclease subunit